MVENHNRLHSFTPERRALRVEDFCRSYGIGKTKAYELIKSGELKSVVIGGRRLIPVDVAEALLRGAC